jgi:hypothetical protein
MNFRWGFRKQENVSLGGGLALLRHVSPMRGESQDKYY